MWPELLGHPLYLSISLSCSDFERTKSALRPLFAFFDENRLKRKQLLLQSNAKVLKRLWTSVAGQPVADGAATHDRCLDNLTVGHAAGPAADQVDSAALPSWTIGPRPLGTSPKMTSVHLPTGRAHDSR